MIAFIDTSSLIKRYIQEKGSDKLALLFQNLTSVVLAPVTLIELYSGLTRRLNDKSLTLKDFRIIEEEMLRNFHHFSIVLWSDQLVTSAVSFVRKYSLRTLDGIQLAAAKISQVEEFVTSDQTLSQAAEREIKKVTLI